MGSTCHHDPEATCSRGDLCGAAGATPGLVRISRAAEGDERSSPPPPLPLLLAGGPGPRPRLLPVQLREQLGPLPRPEAGQAAAAAGLTGAAAEGLAGVPWPAGWAWGLSPRPVLHHFHLHASSHPALGPRRGSPTHVPSSLLPGPLRPCCVRDPPTCPQPTGPLVCDREACGVPIVLAGFVREVCGCSQWLRGRRATDRCLGTLGHLPAGTTPRPCPRMSGSQQEAGCFAQAPAGPCVSAWVWAPAGGVGGAGTGLARSPAPAVGSCRIKERKPGVGFP